MSQRRFMEHSESTRGPSCTTARDEQSQCFRKDNPLQGCCKGKATEAWSYLRLDEFEQIGIDLIRIRCRHTVRETLVGFQHRALHQLDGEWARVSIRDDLVIIAMHDQSRNRELFQIPGKVRLGEGH